MRRDPQVPALPVLRPQVSSRLSASARGTIRASGDEAQHEQHRDLDDQRRSLLRRHVTVGEGGKIDHGSERQDQIEDLLPLGRLLHPRSDGHGAVGDAGPGDALVGDAVAGADVAGAHDASDRQDAEFGIDGHFLRTADDQVAVRQDVRHDGGDREIDGLRPRRGAGALRIGWSSRC